MNEDLAQAESFDSRTIPLDEASKTEILALLAGSLSATGVAAKTEAFWKWKHSDNPAGGSIGCAAVNTRNEVVGVRPLMRWRLRAPDGSAVQAVRPVDTVTHPGWRGRGLFSSLTRSALTKLNPNEVDIIFNTPNSNSLPGYEKMGWFRDASLPILVRPGSLFTLAALIFRRRQVSNPPSLAAISKGKIEAASQMDWARRQQVVDFCVKSEQARTSFGLRTCRDAAFLFWRYFEQPNVDYGFLILNSPSGSLQGVAIVRGDTRRGLPGMVLVDTFVSGDCSKGFRRLIRAALRDVRVAYLITHAAVQSPEYSALRRLMFFPVRRVTLVARTVQSQSDEALRQPTASRDWDLTMSDLEGF